MSLSNSIFKGLLWNSLERLSVQLVQFIIGVIIARILSPTEYGIIGLLTVFISFLSVLVDSGFTKALIQKQDRSQIDLSTIFFFNLIVSFCCYTILWISAPYLSNFYKIPLLLKLTRILGLSLILNALFAIPLTILNIRIDFKTIAKVNLIAVLISGFIGVLLAYDGFGVWSLVFQTLFRSFITAVIMWFILKWKPLMVFSISSIKSMFHFGSKYVLSSLLAMTVGNISSLFIAKLTTAKDLGFYTRGTQFADVVYGTFSSVLNNVLLPGLSTIQSERERLVAMTRYIIKSTAIIVTPILLGITIVANPLIKILLTAKWLPAVPIMQLICVARLISIIAGININLLYVLGRTDLTLKQDYIKIIVRITFLGIAFKYGIFYIALAELGSTIIHFFINCYSPGRILNYGAFKQIKELSPIFFSAIFMIIIMYMVISFTSSDIAKLILAPLIGIPVYLSSLYFFKVNEFFILYKKMIINIREK